MSQAIWSTINPAATSGPQLATLLDGFKEAVVSGLSGTSRPTELDAGGMWIDTTNEGSPNFYWSAKIYTGTIDIEVFRVNLASSTVSISGADTTFELKRYTADTVGPIMKFVKRRIASNGALLSGDIVGTVQFIGRGSDSSNPVVAYMEVEASDNYDGTKSGAFLKFFTTPALSNTAVEHMRLMDGFLGIGTQVPDALVHTKGATGIKSERVEDTTSGALVTLQKSRASGSGASQSGDALGDVSFKTTDSSSNKVESARVRAEAIEAHTATNRGTALDVYTTTTAAATPTKKVSIGDKIETLVPHKINSDELVSQNVATAATINQLSAAKRAVEFTGSTPTDINGINSGHDSKVVLLHNRSSAAVTLRHENAGATAADRLKLPTASPILIPADGSVEVYYCSTDARWKVKSVAISTSGGGGGGGGGALQWVEDALSPILEVENNSRVRKYVAGDTQYLYTFFKVPTSYITGQKVTMKMLYYSPDVTGTVLLTSEATLLRPGSTAIDSTTNQRTSTNTAASLSATANRIETVDLDLTDTSGQINGVGVQGGDLIKVRLTRGTDTATSDVRALADAAEVTVSF